jgi:ABC-type glutathione transport system ATPase component
MLGKQVQKSAGQLADVGRSVMSGLGGEVERRMQAVARDFSQTATADFRAALVERLASDEGKRIMARMRDRVLEQVLAARLGEVASDVAMLPIAEGARFTAELLDKLATKPWFEAVLQDEIAGVLDELGQRSLHDLLSEAGLLESARAQSLGAVEPGLRALVKRDDFGAWLDRLLEASSQP